MVYNESCKFRSNLVHAVKDPSTLSPWIIFVVIGRATNFIKEEEVRLLDALRSSRLLAMQNCNPHLRSPSSLRDKPEIHPCPGLP